MGVPEPASQHQGFTRAQDADVWHSLKGTVHVMNVQGRWLGVVQGGLRVAARACTDAQRHVPCPRRVPKAGARGKRKHRTSTCVPTPPQTFTLLLQLQCALAFALGNRTQAGKQMPQRHVRQLSCGSFGLTPCHIHECQSKITAFSYQGMYTDATQTACSQRPCRAACRQ